MTSSTPPPASKPTLNPGVSPRAGGAPFAIATELEVRGRRVFFRCDASLVAPEGARGKACPAEGARSTLRWLLEQEASVIVGVALSGTGRMRTDIESFGAALSEQLQVEVLLPDECLGEALRMVLGELRSGQLCLLPDLNGCAEDRGMDEAFLRGLASHAELFVSESFADAHESRGTTCRLPRLLRPAAAGEQLIAEVQALQAFRKSSAEPRALILGGDELSRRADFLDSWLGDIQLLCLGGQPLGTWLRAAGKPVGTTVVDEKQLARARTLLRHAQGQGVEVLFPESVVVSTSSGELREKLVGEVSASEHILDWADSSLEQLEKALEKRPRSMLWGTLAELNRGRGIHSTRRVLQAMSRSNGVSLCLGAETHAALLEGELPPVSLYSPGSTPALHFLRGQRLIGLEALVRAG